MSAPELPEHWFRRELGRLVSILSRRFGVHRLELCEDAAQTALLRATQAWSSTLPDDPGAWLYRVAHNYVLDELRRDKRDERYLAEVQAEYAQQEVEDDVLRLLFVCADPAIPPESQLVLALKTLCGFSTGEIALRLFQSEEAIHKRLQRARDAAARAGGASQHRPRARAQRPAHAVPAVQRRLQLRAARSGDPPRAVRRGAATGADAEAGARGRAAGDGRADCAHVLSRGPVRRPRGWHGRPLAARGAGPLAVGPRADPARAAITSRGPPAVRRCRGITWRRASLRSTVWRPRMPRRTGPRSFASTRCSSASPRRRSTF